MKSQINTIIEWNYPVMLRFFAKKEYKRNRDIWFSLRAWYIEKKIIRVIVVKFNFS